MNSVLDDAYFMKRALVEAELAFEKNEIPVGAVVVSEGKLLLKDII